MCYDFGLISGPFAAGALSGGAAAGGAATGGVVAGTTAASISTIGAGVAGSALTGASATGVAAGGTFLTASNIALATSLAGSLISTAGSIAQGQQQKAAYKANAKTQQMQALDAQRRGSMAEGEARQQSKMITGAVNANQGSSGVVAGQDTGLDILAESAEFGARDAAMININAQREAWGLNTQAGNDRFQGQMAGNAGVYRAGTTFLSGVSDAFTPTAPWWDKWKRPSRLPD